MEEHYLDNAATTKPSESVIGIIEEVLRTGWGNPSSLHRKGQEAKAYLRTAARQISSILDCPEEAVFFTSCATESIGTVLKGVAQKNAREGRHILYAQGEHAATRENLKYLQEQGFELEALKLSPDGKILLSGLEEKIRPDTILVTCLHVNNETGVIQPVSQMGAIIKKRNPKCLFHVDATQSFAKYPIYPVSWQIDFLSASAHKINGPKGIGLLYKRRDQYLPPLVLGGGQMRKMRSGTENVPYIAGFGLAATEMWQIHEELMPRLMTLKQEAWQGIAQRFPDARVNGPAPEEGAAHILNVRIPLVRSEVVLHALEDEGIYISSGSACSSNKPGEKSPALSALGLSAAAMDESLRISFGRYTTKEDITALVRALSEKVPVLRRFRPR